MFEYIALNKHANTDINMYQCGIEDCRPGHFYGPAVRDHFLIHYITKGKGIFRVGDREYLLGKGQGFLICPDIVTYYQADEAAPWSYSWVGFNGIKAEQYLKRAGISYDKPIFTYDRDDFVKNCFDDMIEAGKNMKTKDIRLIGLLYLFLSQLMETSEDAREPECGDRSELYVKKAVEYVAMNYSRRMSIAEVADYVGIDRSYLYSLAKKHLGMSLQEYLLQFRVNRACELLKTGSFTVGDISRSVGYEDQLQFSKIFRKLKGLSPREYGRNSRLQG